MKQLIGVILALLAMNHVIGQDLSGRIVDANQKEGLYKASIFIVEVHVGTYTDSAGYFEFSNSLPNEFTIRISHPMYESRLVKARRGDTVMLNLVEHHLDFEDVIVSSPSGGLAKSNAFRIDHLKVKDLNAIQSSSLSEAISNINGVQQASIGVGISKPVIRGMQGVRVLTLLNGMRVENQQWGGDHGMAVTQLGIESVEVIKGPSSLLYGGDAFGGVVYLIDAPYAQQNTQEIEVNSLFETVSMGTTSSLSYKVSKGIFRLNVAGLYANNADYQLPNGKYAQNSRFMNQGAKLGVGISKKNWASHLRYVYSNSRVGIPGHTHDSIIDPTEFQVDNQKRNDIIPNQQAKNHIVSLENKFFIKKNELGILVGSTLNDLTEFEEKVTVPGLKMTLNSTLYSIRFKAVFGEHWQLISGLQGMIQVNSNDPRAEGMLIPDFIQYDNGVYSIAYFSKNKWNIQFGARYDIRTLDVNSINFKENYKSPNFSIGGTHSSDDHTWRLNVSTGYRAPHLSELFSDGIHHGSFRYEIGDRDLQPEYATQIDVSYEMHAEHFEFIVNPFYNYINNYIQIQSVDSIIDGASVFEYRQAELVQLYGLDVGFHYHPHFAHWLHLESSYSYIRGEELTGRSVALMPQARINSFLKLNLKNKGKFKMEQITVQHQYYFDQNQVSAYETTSPDYHLWNLGMDFLYALETPIRISLGVKNILNTAYINHLSGLKNIDLQHPGRSFYINIGYTINGKLKTSK